MYRKTTLQNGVRILSEQLDHFQSVSLGIWVDVGSRDELEQENGISHLIEHMIFKGTRNRSNLQIAKELDIIGGLSNAFTGKEKTCFHAKVLAKHFPLLADILSDIFLNSLFDDKDLDRERQVILQEISMVEDTPEDYIHSLFTRLFWTGHPLGRPILGTGETVSALQKEHVLEYIRRFYTPDRIVISAAGNIRHEDLVSYFEPLFGSLAPPPMVHTRESPQIRPGIAFRQRDLEQVHICLGGKAPCLPSEQRFAAAILNTILGGNMSSRLFQEIREKRGLAYSVYSFLSAYMDTGSLIIYFASAPQEVNRILEVISSEIKRMRKGDISHSELQNAYEHLTGGILLGAENTDTRMMRLARNEYIFGRYCTYEEMVKELEKVTLEDVTALTLEIFDPGRVSLAGLGNFRQEDLDQDTINLRSRYHQS